MPSSIINAANRQHKANRYYKRLPLWVHLVSLLVFVLLSIVTKGNVVIVGKMVNNPHKGYIYFNEPIDGFEDLYFNDKRVALQNDGSFKITSKVRSDGFMNIKLPGKTIKVFVRKTDTIRFTVWFNPDKKAGKYIYHDVRFTGRNGAAYKAYLASPVNADFQKYLLQHLFAGTGKTLPVFYDSINANLNTLLQPFNELVRSKQMDEDIFKAITADISSVFASQVITLFKAMITFKEKNAAANSVFRTYIDALAQDREFYSPAHDDSVRLFMYNRVNPFDPLVLHSFLGMHYPEQYCKDLLNQKLKVPAAYNADFKNLAGIEHFGYLTGKFLEGRLKSHLYWAASTEPSDSVLTKTYRLFTRNFPSSAFRPILSARINQAIHDRSLSADVKSSIKFIKTAPYSNLAEVVRANFVSDFVFVDVWATWCAPCIYDFSFKNRIALFLDTNNIETLYLSIDKETEKDKWRNIAYTKQLNGLHYLASDKMIDDFKKQVYRDQDVTIPRYLLIKRSGELVHLNLPRPSDAGTLVEAIRVLIKK